MNRWKRVVDIIHSIAWLWIQTHLLRTRNKVQHNFTPINLTVCYNRTHHFLLYHRQYKNHSHITSFGYMYVHIHVGLTCLACGKRGSCGRPSPHFQVDDVDDVSWRLNHCPSPENRKGVVVVVAERRRGGGKRDTLTKGLTLWVIYSKYSSQKICT